MYENLPFKTSHVFSSHSHTTPHCAICPTAVSPWVTVKCWGKASQVRLQYSFTQASFLGPKQQKGEVKWQKSWCNLVKRGVLVICLDVTYRYRIIEMFVRLYHIWMSIPFLENTTYCFFFSVSIKFWQLRMVQNLGQRGRKFHQFFPIVVLIIILKSETNMHIGHFLVVPSRELTYPSLVKGKSSKVPLGGDMLVPRRVPQMFFFQIYHQPNIKWWTRNSDSGSSLTTVGVWWSNIAMENPPFVEVLPALIVLIFACLKGDMWFFVCYIFTYCSIFFVD